MCGHTNVSVSARRVYKMSVRPRRRHLNNKSFCSQRKLIDRLTVSNGGGGLPDVRCVQTRNTVVPRSFRFIYSRTRRVEVEVFGVKHCAYDRHVFDNRTTVRG